ncbi:RHTO0S05e06392g1_1 [Rhodotorula toruloides]|uniref:RHTO0S05e06392g1_1 n=1 Tax=Rhodotorula toruloides TaxID=5286 RepID=A0A061AZ72_RHOTO|nr:RHTO0S05e06392g1_1 [Rhodotorula toruloides]
MARHSKGDKISSHRKDSNLRHTFYVAAPFAAAASSFLLAFLTAWLQAQSKDLLPDYVMMVGVTSAVLAVGAGIASIWAGYMLHRGANYHDRHYDDDTDQIKHKHPFKAWHRMLVLGLHAATFLSECCYLYMLISTTLVGDKKELRPPDLPRPDPRPRAAKNDFRANADEHARLQGVDLDDDAERGRRKSRSRSKSRGRSASRSASRARQRDDTDDDPTEDESGQDDNYGDSYGDSGRKGRSGAAYW